MDDDAIDEEEDAQRRRSRSRKTSKEANNPALAYQLHPLKVVLHVYDTEVSGTKRRKLITLKFEYLAKLNVVCVGSEDSEGVDSNILCNLFPDDTGLELPHQVCFPEHLIFISSYAHVSCCYRISLVIMLCINYQRQLVHSSMH
jgi:THO complex subunit 5